MSIRRVAFVSVLALAASSCRDGSKMDAIERRLRSDQKGERMAAADDLGHMARKTNAGFPPAGSGPLPATEQQRRAVELLVDLVAHDPDAVVCNAAAQAIGYWRPAGPLPELVRCVASRPECSMWCAKSVLVVADAENVRGLVELLNRLEGDDGRVTARIHLPSIGEAVVPYLMELVPRASADTIYDIIGMLSRIDTQQSLDAMVTLLDHANGSVRARTLIDLELSGRSDQYLSRIARMLDDPYEGARTVAARILKVSGRNQSHRITSDAVP